MTGLIHQRFEWTPTYFTTLLTILLRNSRATSMRGARERRKKRLRCVKNFQPSYICSLRPLLATDHYLTTPTTCQKISRFPPQSAVVHGYNTGARRKPRAERGWRAEVTRTWGSAHPSGVRAIDGVSVQLRQLSWPVRE